MRYFTSYLKKSNIIYLIIYLALLVMRYPQHCFQLIKSDRKYMYSGAKKYLVSHQLCKFSHLKKWERPVIFIIGIPQLWETK